MMIDSGYFKKIFMCGPVWYDQDYNLFSFCIYGEDEFRTLNACEICVPCSVLTRSMPPPVFPLLLHPLSIQKAFFVY